MFDLTIDLRQLDTFTAKVAGFDLRLRKALLGAIRRATIAVEARAKLLVSGQVLHVRTGTLRRSISYRVEALADRVQGTVTAGARYARIHEMGGKIPAHDVRPKNAKALHFFMGGGGPGGFHGYGMTEVFARSVHIPDVRMPERSYLRRALREMTPQIRAEIRQAVREAAAFGGSGIEV